MAQKQRNKHNDYRNNYEDYDPYYDKEVRNARRNKRLRDKQFYDRDE